MVISKTMLLWERTLASISRRGRLSRKEIVSAAMTGFHAHGYAETTLASVARHLNVTDKALYYYFRSKDALYLETLLACSERIAAIIGDIDRKQSKGLARLKAFACAMIREPECLRLYFRTLPDHLTDTDQGKHIRSAKSAHEEIMIRWIEEGIADGSIGPGNPKLLWRWNQGALLWLDIWSRSDADYGAPGHLETEAMTMLDRTLARPFSGAALASVAY